MWVQIGQNDKILKVNSIDFCILHECARWNILSTPFLVTLTIFYFSRYPGSLN